VPENPGEKWFQRPGGRGWHPAYALLDAGQPISVLITDVRMPRLSGPDLVEAITTQRPDLPVLYVSGNPIEPGVMEQHLFRRNCQYLAKPFTAAELVCQVQNLLEKPKTRVACDPPRGVVARACAIRPFADFLSKPAVGPCSS
jgi:DNA-binding NtrC family response regulator